MIPQPDGAGTRAQAQWMAGVFRYLRHHVPADARPIDFHGQDIWPAACGAMCVPMPGGTPRPTCEKCLAWANEWTTPLAG